VVASTCTQREIASSLSILEVSKVFRAADGTDVVALAPFSLSVAPGEMVSLSGLVARRAPRPHAPRVSEFLRLVGLSAFADHYPHQLSGGMAQRTALARALINDPKLLLLDEPLGALDQFTRMRMQDEVLRLQRTRGTTMLLVTHDIDEAIYMSDRIVLMTARPGRIDRVIDVAIDRPRHRDDPRFLALRSEILRLLHFAGGDKPAAIE
jgi:ABC-type nitrate/sulfonate/bicarbonate transport system ATPase subunit